MDKKLLVKLLLGLALSLWIPGAAFANPSTETTQTADSSIQQTDDDWDDYDDDDGCVDDVKLSAEQKKQLDLLVQRLEKDNEELFQKYAEYGAISKMQKDRKIQQMHRYFDVMKKRNYLTCIEFDDDEMEYEHPHHHKDDEDDKYEGSKYKDKKHKKEDWHEKNNRN
ncbi:hypothetical protein [Ferviditalea candida]|uniref:Uncharacterized protein n=1 Tax=Ferviditalea candida TaxID=3108399 RepID=A0ABU5ZGM7_9BACL|nr:hypothetical protein [Paenibacillaceae bacterium T2]